MAEHVLDLVRTAAPGVDVVTLDEAKSQCRVEFDDYNTLISSYIAVGQESLDGYAGELGRCLVEQQWTLHLPRFPHPMWNHQLCREDGRVLKLPLPPLIAVDTVTYLDPAGSTQTFDPANYSVLAGPRSAIALKSSASWPDTAHDPRAVTVVFRAGYAAKPNPSTDADPHEVPAPIRQAILLRISDLYENRDAQSIVESRATWIDNPVYGRLLAPFRVLDL